MVADVFFPSPTPPLPDGSYRHVSRQRTTTGIAVLCDLCVPLWRNDRLDPSLRQRFVNLPLVVSAVAVESIDFARRLIQQVVHLTAIVATVRLVITAKTYTAKYRDGNHHVQEVATGCRTEDAARAVLSDLVKRADKVRSGIRSTAEDAVIDHQPTPLADHIAAYFEHQRAKGVTPRQIADSRSRLNRVLRECGFARLTDLLGTALEMWLATRQADGMGAVTRNAYREAWVTFGNWCVRNRRLLSNPFTSVPKADAKADRRRTRRALTGSELTRLLDVARRRPVTIRRGKSKGEAVAVLRDDTPRHLERLGMERALIYKTLVLTGLRKGELASITVGQVVLDGPMPHLVLEAADEKNREGSTIPLRADLAADLRGWLADKAAALREAAQRVPVVRFDSKPGTQPGRFYGTRGTITSAVVCRADPAG